MRIVAHQKVMLPLLLLLLAVGPSWAQRPPPNYSPDALPDTSFSCTGRTPGGYYADVEAGCQMFHVCGASQGPSFRFLCPNDTVFDQQNLICANWFQVVCEHDSVLHARNFEIFKTHSNKEVSFNTLHEADLPALDDYDYETGFGAGAAFDSSPRVSAQRATTTSSPVRQFDQFVAASTARPLVVTAPNRGRWRGSTVTGSSTTEPARFLSRHTTEPARFLPRQNSLDRGTGKRLTSSDRSVESRGRLSSPVSNSVERSSQVFDSLNSQSLQDQGRSAAKSIQTSGNVAQDFTSTGSQSFQRTSGRVPPTSAPAESQNIERTSRRFNSISPSAGSRRTDERPASSRSFQKTSGRTTLTAAINVVGDSDLTGPAVSVVPTAAAQISGVITTTQPQLSSTVRPASTDGQTTPPTLSRASAPAARVQSQSAARVQSPSAARAPPQSAARAPPQSAARTQSQSAARAQPQSAARTQSQSAARTQSQFVAQESSQFSKTRLNDINTNELLETGPAKQAQFSAVRPAPTSTPPSPVRVTFSTPLEPESRPLELESRVTTTEPAPPLSPVARNFFGANVLPEVTARTVQSVSGRTGAARKVSAVAAGGRSQAQLDDDVAVTTFHPRVSTTLPPPTTTGGSAGVGGNTETTTDSEIEIITEITTRAGPRQSSGTTVPTGRRRGFSGRRRGSARRGSDSTGPARPRATVATPGRARASPAARPPAPRTSTAAVTARPRSAAGRRGRGGRRFESARVAVKPGQRRRPEVRRVTSTAVKGVQQNSIGVDLPEAKFGGKKDDAARRGANTASGQTGSVTAQKAPVDIVIGQAKQEPFTSQRRPSTVRSTTETASVDVDLTTADSISRPTGVRAQITQTTPESNESPLTTEASLSSPQSVTTTTTTTTTEATATTPLIIRRRIRVRGRPSRRPSRRPVRRQATTTPPAQSSAPSPAPLLLPTNKEAAPGGSRLLRRPKLQLSSALPGVGQSRRLQRNTAAREARSGATRLVAPSRGRYGRRPAAALAPAAARGRSVQALQSRRAGSLLSDYDYEYYDDESDALFRKLAEANELVLNDLSKVRRQN